MAERGPLGNVPDGRPIPAVPEGGYTPEYLAKLVELGINQPPVDIPQKPADKWPERGGEAGPSSRPIDLDPVPPKGPAMEPAQTPAAPLKPTPEPPKPAPEAPKTPASETKKPATKETLEVPEAKKICVEQKIMWPDIETLLEEKFNDLEQAQYAVENAKSLFIRMHDQMEIVETDMRRLRNLLISVDTTELRLAKPLNLCPVGKKADKLEGVRRKVI